MPPRKTATAQRSSRQATLGFRSKVSKAKPSSAPFKKESPAPSQSLEKEAASSVPEVAEIHAEDEKHAATDVDPAAPQATDEELATRDVTHKQLVAYYDGILVQRKTKPVHQEALSLEEKILRHFDMSSQYGPCIGISRVDRWKRAQRLRLNPPVEVFSVCLQVVEENGKSDTRRDTRIAYIDEFLSTKTAVE